MCRYWVTVTEKLNVTSATSVTWATLNIIFDSATFNIIFDSVILDIL